MATLLESEWYNNLNGNSSVVRVRLYLRDDGRRELVINFDTGWTYSYIEGVGNINLTIINTMMNLARQGRGLNRYININKPRWAGKSS